MHFQLKDHQEFRKCYATNQLGDCLAGLDYMMSHNGLSQICY